MINKMKGGEIQLPSKVEANHTRLFADLLLRQIKAEAIVLGTIFAIGLCFSVLHILLMSL